MSIPILPGDEKPKRFFELPLALTPAQEQIDECKARWIIVRAGRKFGKTVLAIKKAIEKAGKQGAVVWYVGPTYKQTKMIAWKEFKKLIPREALAKKPNETELVFTLKNGAEIYLMGADNPDSLRGPAPDFVVMEEAAMQASEVWKEVIRPNLTPKRAGCMFISTPKGYNWFWDLEEKAKKLMAEGSTSWAVFHFTIHDNPHISPDEITEAKQECDDDRVWNQEYLALYEASVGRVFAALDEVRHFTKLLLPKGPFKAYRGIDWGQRDDTACLWGRVVHVIDKPGLHVYREHFAKGLPASTQAEAILSRDTSMEQIDRSAISHDSVKEDAEMQGLTVKWHMENAGLKPLYPMSRKKKQSRQMLNQIIKEDRIIIDPSCVKLKKQLFAYEWKDTTLEETVDGEVDGVDALHYLVELLQFELFLNRPEERVMDLDQLKEAIKAEKAALHRLTPGKDFEGSLVDIKVNPGGYIG